MLVVVVTQTGECLLLRRQQPVNFWQSITGSLERGETPRQAAVRELNEETGLLAGSMLMDLHQSRLFPIIRPWRVRYAPGVCFNREYWFAVCLPSRRLIRLNPREHAQSCWLPLQQAILKTSSWTNRDALRLVARHLATFR